MFELWYVLDSYTVGVTTNTTQSNSWENEFVKLFDNAQCANKCHGEFPYFCLSFFGFWMEFLPHYTADHPTYRSYIGIMLASCEMESTHCGPQL